MHPRAGWALAVACLMVPCLAAPLVAQSPTFEVATIKVNPGPLRIGIVPHLRNGTLTATNVTLRQMVATAYGLTGPRIIGPDWLDNDYFDFLAKSPKGVPDSELKPMLQALLKDRFKLTTHLEKRELPLYYLVVAENGAKMSVYPAPERPSDYTNVRGLPMVRGTLTAAELANLITRIVGRPVIDKTGLTERYNLSLVFAPFSPQAGDNVTEFAPPDIFTAIQEQLGLKLDSDKDKLDVIVVDHMERTPTEN
jgi:uncharacterized protein (TIGR03435 family)